MSEPRTFIIDSEVDFDATTKFTQTLKDFTRVGRSMYLLSVSERFGRVDGELFGSTSEPATKMVGVAGRHFNPMSVVRVIPRGSGPDQYRDEVDLTPEMQYVVMYAGDELAILTEDGGRTAVTITVNQLSEAQSIDQAIAHPRTRHWRRFRIIRDDGTGFVPGFGQPPWRPAFTWRAAQQLVVAQEVNRGPIPIDTLCTFPKFASCLLRVRYANSDTDSKLHIWEPETESHIPVQSDIKNMEWSKTISVSHDDHIALRSGAPANGSKIVCDIEVCRIRPRDLLLGHYNRGK